jgi:hypothetical protein
VQNANYAPLTSSPPQNKRRRPSGRSSPRLVRGLLRGLKVCYQVLTQFAFYQRKPALVSTHIKKQNAKAFLVRSGLPFGSGLKYCRFFKTKKEAAQYVLYLHAVYNGRIIPHPAQLCARTGEGVIEIMPHLPRASEFFGAQ